VVSIVRITDSAGVPACKHVRGDESRNPLS
jgi:hypothetical protein